MADLVILISEWMEIEDCDMALGPEKVLNGGFDGEDNWQGWSGGWSVSVFFLDYLTDVDFEDDFDEVSQLLSIEAGKTYQVEYTIPYVLSDFGTNWSIVLGGTSIEISKDEITGLPITYTQNVIAGSDDSYIKIRAYNRQEFDVIYIDNVSVKEVLPDGGLSGAEYLSIIDDER